MVRTTSTMLPLGTPAPPFALPDTDGNIVALEDFADAPALLVLFLCNHCPFVKHVAFELAAIGREYGEKGVAIVAINPNDPTAYPEDAPDRMKEEKQRAGYTFPYLFDESQDVARAHNAVCTPDIFLFDHQHRLFYRGQIDDSRPGNGLPLTGRDLREALDAVLSGLPAPVEQRPSIGCSIKWRQE
ncbi:MAG: thioredoxin family protein [Longimicrobiales bacterium]